MGCGASTATKVAEAKDHDPASTRPVTPAAIAHPVVIDVPHGQGAREKEADAQSTDTVVLATTTTLPLGAVLPSAVSGSNSSDYGSRQNKEGHAPDSAGKRSGDGNGGGGGSKKGKRASARASAVVHASLRPRTAMATNVLKVLLVGPAGAGKTVLASRLEGRNFTDAYTQADAVQFFLATLPYPAAKKATSSSSHNIAGTGSAVIVDQEQQHTRLQPSDDAAKPQQEEVSLQLWDVPAALVQPTLPSTTTATVATTTATATATATAANVAGGDGGAHGQDRDASPPGRLPPFASEWFDVALIAVEASSPTMAADARAYVEAVKAHASQPEPTFYLVLTKQDVADGSDDGDGVDAGEVQAAPTDSQVTEQPQQQQQQPQQDADEGIAATNDGSWQAKLSRDKQSSGEGDSEAVLAAGLVSRVLRVSAKYTHRLDMFEKELARALSHDGLL
ncbi:hypothetical protein PTSG_12856 [Salpingoeca rosetta]|uniref:Uncharacterized protein n=1 Tax=Salpingoeca rosetta (strain ATCC 50818 / BSB-021) TaxID=946362 RepID=F2UN63_SALR5|nr:uncharacterized protein PTSG_12856 [Salpingoeca rosetta]EGD78562.1 hypothetical protein PTSG_12856 [Salpingoeca rosetta]|eukprot:XP_004989511.1 hypothetical protein PTSG_12856 [Salpingoeca rosetta]